MSRRLMLKQGGSAPVLNGLLDRDVSTSGKAYSITNNQFKVTTLDTTADYCLGRFKFPFEIKTGDVIFLKITSASGSIGAYQRVRLYNEDGSATAFIINDNKSLNALKTGISATVSTNVTVGYLGFARRTGAASLPAIFTPILQVNGVDMIN